MSDFSAGTADSYLPANAGDMDSIPGPGGFHMPGAAITELMSHNY